MIEKYNKKKKKERKMKMIANNYLILKLTHLSLIYYN
jgi:hypothetical protein